MTIALTRDVSFLPLDCEPGAPKEHKGAIMNTTRREIMAMLAALGSMLPLRAAAGNELKMGLLVSGSVAEEGWNRIAYNALKGVEKELGAQVSYVELGQNPAAFEKAFRDYAGQSYQVVLGHGFEYGDAAVAVSEDFPETVFLISSSFIKEGKVVGLNTDNSQAFYLMGIIAAKMGKRAGLVGGMEIPPIQHGFEGFKKGARSVDPDFQISEAYIGSFTDATAVKEATVSMIAQGADFVLPHAGGAGIGGFQAIAEAGPEIRTFSVFTDYTDIAPDNILGLYLTDYARGVIGIVRDIQSGRIPTSNIEFGFNTPEVMQFDYNERAHTPVPEGIRTYVEDVRAGIAAGGIQTM